MTQVKSGDTVRVHYIGTLADGTEFDNSTGREPLEFVVGTGQIIPGFDNALPGMAVGEKKTVNVPAEKAYGEADPNARQSVPRDQIPSHVPLEVGTQLQMQTAEGQNVPITVAEVDDDTVVLDANHPLAGRDLVFSIELVSIN